MDKICGICGTDCSDRPRVKDAKGRYFCKSCAMDRVKARTPAAAAPPAEIDDFDPYDIDDESVLPAGMLNQAHAPTQCPACSHMMAAGAKVCISCGYNVEAGIQTSTLVQKSKAKGGGRKHQCRECGYDLKGLRADVCPECGTRIRLTKDEERAQVAREVYKEEWRKPAIYFGVGFGGLALIHTIIGQPEYMIPYSILLGVQIVVGYAVLWLCFNFLGDIGTPLLNLARLASIYVMVDLIGFFVGFIPIFIIPFVIKLLAYIGLFSDAFDTDWQDAFLVIFLTWIAKVLLFLVATLYLAGLLSGL